MSFYGQVKNSLLIAGLLMVSGLMTPAFAQDIKLITKDQVTGDPLKGFSHEVSLSADGRFTAFATDSFAGASGFQSFYIHDRLDDSIQILETPVGFLHTPFISANGQFAAIFCYISGDEYLYIFDRNSNSRELVFQGFDFDWGVDRGLSISDDGNIIVFDATYIPDVDGKALTDIYAYDRQAQSFELLSVRNDGSPATGTSFTPQLTGDGQKVLFLSEDTALDSTSSQSGLFLRDLSTDTNLAIAYNTTLEDGSTQKITGGYVTSDGRFVAYMTEKRDSQTNNAISWNSYLWSEETQSSELVFENLAQPSEYVFGNPGGSISVSDDGNKILFGAVGYSSTTRVKTSEDFTIADERLYLYDRNTDSKRMVATSNNFPVLYQNFDRVGSDNGFRQQVSRDGSSLAFSALTHTSGDEAPSFNMYSGSTNASSEAPIADVGINVEFIGGIAQPSGLSSTDDITPSVNLNYQWEYVGFPTTYDALGIENGNTANPSFLDGGAVTVKLIVRDSDGLVSEPDYMVIDQSNYAPRANAGSDQTVKAGDLVSLDGNESTDLDGDPLTYQWSLNSKPPTSVAAITSSGATASFTPDVEGNYYAALIVNDGTVDSRQDLVKITVLANPLAPAIQSLQNARDTIAAMNASDLPWSTGRTRLLQFLDDAIFQIGKDRPLMARAYLNKARQRVDGCARRGAPDERDWVKTCEAQSSVHPDLNTAWDILITY